MLTSLWNHGLQPLQWFIAIAASLLAASIDIRTHRIPNALTGPLLLGGLIWASAVAGWAGLGDGLCGMLVAGLPFFVMWVLRAGGAGDAKMMMALGAWLGVINGLAVLFAVALAGGVVSLAYAIHRRQVAAAFGNIGMVLYATLILATTGRQISNRREMIPSIQSPQAFPYGIAIFLGTCLAGIGVWWWRMG